MPDIFLSYSRKDEDKARAVRAALQALDYEVFWDRELTPGTPDWDSRLKDTIANSGCVIVLWSRDSVQSGPVKHEAEIAFQAGKLIPALLAPLGVTDFPMGHFHAQAAVLIDWAEDAAHPEFQKLAAAVAAKIGPGTSSLRRDSVLQERLASAQAEAGALGARITELSTRLSTAQADRDRAVAERGGLQADIQQLTAERDQALRRADQAEQAQAALAKREGAAARRRDQWAERPVVQRSGLGLWGAGVIAALAAGAGFWGGKSDVDAMVMGLWPAPSTQLGRPVTVLDGSQVTVDTPPGTVFKDCDYCPEMVVVRIEGLNFDSGSLRPRTTETQAFAAGRFEITLEQFQSFNPDFVQDTYYDTCDNLSASNFPALCISEQNAEEYTSWLSAQTTQEYQIPTWAQFELLVSVAELREIPTVQICAYANLRDRSSQLAGANPDCDDGARRATRVGSYEPDSLGLYDIVGNAAELAFADDRYVRLGGSYYSPRSNLNLTEFGDGANRPLDIGFRVIRRLAPSPNAPRVDALAPDAVSTVPAAEPAAEAVLESSEEATLR